MSNNVELLAVIDTDRTRALIRLLHAYALFVSPAEPGQGPPGGFGGGFRQDGGFGQGRGFGAFGGRQGGGYGGQQGGYNQGGYGGQGGYNQGGEFAASGCCFGYGLSRIIRWLWLQSYIRQRPISQR